MMRSLLIVIAFLSLLSASAQMNNRVDFPVSRQSVTEKPTAKMREMKMRVPGETVAAPLRSTGEIKPYYRRPAGAFYSSQIAVDGVYTGLFMPGGILLMKPYCDYTFLSYDGGADGDDEFFWEYDAGGEHHSVNSRDLTVKYGIEKNYAPELYVLQNGDYMNSYFFQYPRFKQTEVVGNSYNPTTICSVPTTRMIDEDETVDFLLSSKTFCLGGRNGDQETLMTYYSGAQPYGSNDLGWWFGKNGYHQNFFSKFYIDGIAQAFEKPTAPYLLKKVMMHCAVLDVMAPVTMTCKIYKLNSIPDYNDSVSISLPEEPDSLIATGHALVTPRTFEDMGAMVSFDLFTEVDGLEIETEPTIDCAILVVVDGYNDDGMENLKDFSAEICADMKVDEGFGELAYIKYGSVGQGHVVTYSWRGLNNFFYDGTMKTAFSIYIVADMPYLTFNYSDEDGEYTFPNKGGLMEKSFGDSTTRSIEFRSWTPSADDAWLMTCNGDDVPDWLTIELTDIEQDGEFSGLVNAEVYADPLPEGVAYREAIVRFEFPGAYLDYKFMQGEIVPPINPCTGPIVDYELNIADINYLIFLMIEGMYDNCYDANGDGELTIADVNAMIDLILE